MLQIAPKGNRQLAGQSDDHDAPHALGLTLGALAEPLAQRRLWLMLEPHPGRLGHGIANQAVAGLGDTLLVCGFGSVTSGIPQGWVATEGRPGANLLPDLSPQTTHRIAQQVRAVERAGDIVIASIHWGPNWGYEIPEQLTAFAHGLIDEAGVAGIYGHSSHHAAIEVYRDRPILYGCSYFLDDYEGIRGYEMFRGDLVLMYFLTMRASRGTLARLTMVPLQIRNFRLNRASPADAAWLHAP